MTLLSIFLSLLFSSLSPVSTNGEVFTTGENNGTVTTSGSEDGTRGGQGDADFVIVLDGNP